MDWYTFDTPIRGKMRQVAARMTAARAERLGAVHAPDFDEEAARRAGMVISRVAAEGGLEVPEPLTAEIPHGDRRWV